MAADEEAEDFLFGGETGVLVPVGDVWQFIIVRFGIFLLEDAKQAMLAGFSIALSLLRLFHRLVEYGRELRATSHGIHGATLDE